jgi:hypothetical protein
MTKQKVITFLVGWVILAAIFAGILLPINTPRAWHIYSDAEEGVGIVTSAECSNHARVIYGFDVDSHHYTGGESMGARCTSIAPGHSLPIFYNKHNPSENEALPPAGVLWNEIITVVMVCLTFPPLMMWRATRWISRRSGNKRD